ncbi:TetR/AcrR family transcriptional regulator [Aeromicrobium ginsengisoli]|uniref:TetR/AcrR family transcriptional regulator n=1 Tax=Aeromicrobium ginsengisoli TaxID=363867 RepID=A0A5M4FF00_9ACTN|nr:TetR/AcrR family transcriptional regulator [Aeromicrobium ginsengisoli]KAA1397789.1 TetR/AcrR family transcriptional regulator [Aeromicrobium ginsengisoli]
MPAVAADEISPTQTRLLDAAAELFYTDGVNVGVDALCRAAGVSKRSMYQFFDSKDDLLAASLARGVPGYLATLFPRPGSALTPRERVLYVFERLEQVIADPSFRGCPYVSAAMEVKSPEHPARLVARGFHNTLTEYFRAAVTAGSATDPHLLAKQLTIVHDGASARAVVQSEATPGLALATATALLDQAHIGASTGR